jgi:hypothetical protein
LENLTPKACLIFWFFTLDRLASRSFCHIIYLAHFYIMQSLKFHILEPCGLYKIIFSSLIFNSFNTKKNGQYLRKEKKDIQ